MSLITRCPACQTSFRVVPDQLRMSEGWVRCGQCSEIFDAASNLQASPEVPESREPAPGLAQAQRPAEPSAADLQSALREVVASRAMRAESAVAPEDRTPLKPGLEHGVHLDSARNDRLRDNWEQAENSERTDRKDRSENFSEGLVDHSPQPEISFLGKPFKASKESAWHQTWVRVSLSALCLLLLVVLGTQALVHERDRLASYFPETKPWMQTACGYLKCIVSTVKQIESIVVESSSFTRLRGDVYRLGVAIKNNAAIELGMPAIELTLTDAQDQTLMRRVFSSAELGARTSTLAANAEWTAGISVSAKVGAGLERIAGYRVLAFYP